MACFTESLRRFEELNTKDGIVNCLVGLAGAFGTEGQPERAARLFGTVNALYDVTSMHMAPVTRAEYTHNMTDTQAQLDEATWAAAWAVGQAMSLEEAVADAFQGRIREAGT